MGNVHALAGGRTVGDGIGMVSHDNASFILGDSTYRPVRELALSRVIWTVGVRLCYDIRGCTGQRMG